MGAQGCSGGPGTLTGRCQGLHIPVLPGHRVTALPGDSGTPGVSQHGVTGILGVPSSPSTGTCSIPPEPVGAQLVTSGDRGCPQPAHTVPGERGPGGDRDRRGDREGMEQEWAAGPRPFLYPPCLGMVPHPLAPTSTRSLCHRRVTSGNRGGQGKGTASSLGRTGPPKARQPQACEGPPMGRCGGLPCAPTLAGGLERGPPTPSMQDSHPWNCAALGGHGRGLGVRGRSGVQHRGVQLGTEGCGGAQWGAAGSLQPWPCVPWQLPGC